MRLAERIATIVITATLTSAAWVVFGGSLLRQAPMRPQPDTSPASLVAPRTAERIVVPTTVPAPAQRSLPTAPGRWLVPVANIAPSQLSDTFTQSRAGGARVHNAIDIMAPTGTPVIAAIAGTVEKLFLSDEGGKTIYIRSPDRRTITYYAHLNAYAPSLKEGMEVKQGQVLGTVGYTGNASPDAPHLHFAVMQTSPDKAWSENSLALNPYPLLTAH